MRSWRPCAAHQAAALVAAERFDLVVLDLFLGGHDRDGLDVLAALGQDGRRTPVLVLSGLVTPELEVEVLELGPDAVLLKPQPLVELARRARDLMGLVSPSGP
jgi:DNA-binding response OmpR family regulator